MNHRLDMSLFLSNLFHLLLIISTFSMFCFPSANSHKISHTNLVEQASCPLDFNALRVFFTEAPRKRAFINVPNLCRYISGAIHFLRSEYLRTNGYFVPPAATFQACWGSYRSLISEFLNGFDIQTACGYRSKLISESCMNIPSQAEFESKFPDSKLLEMRLYCNRALSSVSACESCTDKLLSIGKMYLDVPEADQNVSTCSSYLFIYAAAVINQFGPTDPSTARCFFRIERSISSDANKHHRAITSGVAVGCVIGVLGAAIAVWLLWMLHKKCEGEKHNSVVIETSQDHGLGLNCKSNNLVKFKIEEIRKATMNFSRHNIIGKGGFGNVYKGRLPDGSEVAFKRFKNCSASGDATFAHEVEIIASVRHVNLVALRGYCTTTIPMEGHQRIIVCELMRNGSLYDHLYGSGTKKLSWPIRQKIALGTARGLGYLHYGVHPAIIHRDIKACNILLDEEFEPKVADFGLARFNSQEMTHLSTRVAGTLGYVAPEYALYGMLTERSDVYSFGVVLLELLSGKKAYEYNDQGNVSLLTDWAWLLVKEGRALDVIEEKLPELGSPDVMEQYVHIALICAHPLLHARPTMDQIVKILEANLVAPSSLGAYIAASNSEVSSIGSSYNMFCSSISSDETSSDTRDARI